MGCRPLPALAGTKARRPTLLDVCGITGHTVGMGLTGLQTEHCTLAGGPPVYWPRKVTLPTALASSGVSCRWALLLCEKRCRACSSESEPGGGGEAEASEGAGGGAPQLMMWDHPKFRLRVPDLMLWEEQTRKARSGLGSNSAGAGLGKAVSCRDSPSREHCDPCTVEGPIYGAEQAQDRARAAQAGRPAGSAAVRESPRPQTGGMLCSPPPDNCSSATRRWSPSPEPRAPGPTRGLCGQSWLTVTYPGAVGASPVAPRRPWLAAFLWGPRAPQLRRIY